MNNVFEKRIGNTVYVVDGKAAETAKKTLDEKIRELCLKEIENPDFGRMLAAGQVNPLPQNAVGA